MAGIALCYKEGLTAGIALCFRGGAHGRYSTLLQGGIPANSTLLQMRGSLKTEIALFFGGLTTDILVALSSPGWLKEQLQYSNAQKWHRTFF